MNAKEFSARQKRRWFVVAMGTTLATIPACGRSSPSENLGPVPSVSGSEQPKSTPAQARPAGQDELALVAPLEVGGSLEGYAVMEIQAIRHGVLNLVCRKERSTVRLWIALASDKGPEPPARAGKYAVFYSASGVDPAGAEQLSKALAEIVDKHADVPVPKGMTEFVPVAIPL